MNNQEQDHFDDALARWAAQPPRTPADQAARQVMARLPGDQTGGLSLGSSWRLATAAVGLALLLIVGWAKLSRIPDSVPAAHDLSLPPLAEDVVLLWLDEETPLYLTVAPPATKGGSR